MLVDKRIGSIMVKVGPEEKRRIKTWCFLHGTSQSTFALEAIREKIERLREKHEIGQPPGAAWPPQQPTE